MDEAVQQPVDPSAPIDPSSVAWEDVGQIYQLSPDGQYWYDPQSGAVYSVAAGKWLPPYGQVQPAAPSTPDPYASASASTDASTWPAATPATSPASAGSSTAASAPSIQAPATPAASGPASSPAAAPSIQAPSTQPYILAPATPPAAAAQPSAVRVTGPGVPFGGPSRVGATGNRPVGRFVVRR